MAYTTVHQWAFQEAMGANADNYLQIYSNNLADLATRAQPRSYACYAGKESKVMLVHFGKWLYYKNLDGKTATIKAYGANIGDNVTLSDAFAEGGTYVDLSESVDWLVPGMSYFVENVLFAIEMETI